MTSALQFPGRNSALSILCAVAALVSLAHANGSSARATSIERPVQAGFFTPAREGMIWDTWIYHHEGTYYMFYLAGRGGRWDGHELATSDDGVHWKEHGVLIKPRPEVTWMGTGHIWKSPDFERNGTWIMNYSEWFGDKQDIAFVTSTNLLNWTKVDEKHRFVQDPRWYQAKGRWDCIDTVQRPDGSLYGYFTADPDASKVTYRFCGFGFAESRDGISWTALPPVEGDISGEFGGIQKIGDRYFILIGEGRVAVADKPEGPFYAQKKNPNAFVYAQNKSTNAIAAGRDTYFPRFFHNAPGGPLVNNFFTKSVVHAAPLKSIEVDREGTLRLKWWPDNSRLKARVVEAGLAKREMSFSDSVRALDNKLELNRTYVIEGTLQGNKLSPRKGDRSGIIFEQDGGGIQCLLFSREAVQFGESNAASDQFDVIQDCRRDLDLGETPTFRLVIRNDMMELYVNDYLMNLKALRYNGPIGFMEEGDSEFKNITVWESR